jgi:N-methylhydantoinase A/oxoprolinase/acetone carboxylase beta subunit
LNTGECAAGIVRVAEAEMLRALRVMTVERGIDPREYALMPFGGAGPLHACALAAELGIERVLCPRTSGVLCALGLAAAAPRRDVSRTVMLRGSALTEEALARVREELLAQAGSAHSDDEHTGIGDVDPPRAAAHSPAPVHLDARRRTLYELRYRGQSHELAVESHATDPQILREQFARAHERRYGYRDDSGEVELVTIRASVWGAAPRLSLRGSDDGGGLRASIAGPAVHPLPEATLYVPPGWSGETDRWGTVRLEKSPSS